MNLSGLGQVYVCVEGWGWGGVFVSMCRRRMVQGDFVDIVTILVDVPF